MPKHQVAGHTVKCSWGKESGDPNNLPTNAQVPITHHQVSPGTSNAPSLTSFNNALFMPGCKKSLKGGS